MKKNIVIFGMIFVIITALCGNFVYAMAPLDFTFNDTDWQEIVSQYVEGVSSVTANVESDKITLNIDGTDYVLEYVDNAGKAKYTITFEVATGMTYDEFKEKNNISTRLPMIIYSAIAKENGVSLTDSMFYFSSEYLSSLTGVSSEIVILDDNNLDPGVTVTPGDPSIFLVSEFPTRCVEYVGKYYENDIIADDSSSEGINSFSLKYSKDNETATSIQIISEIEIDPNADFESLTATTGGNEEENQPESGNGTENGQGNNAQGSGNENKNDSKDKEFPKAGIDINTINALKISLVIVAVVLGVFAILNYKKKLKV